MASQVKVTSLDALESFRASLIIFLTKSRRSRGRCRRRRAPDAPMGAERSAPALGKRTPPAADGSSPRPSRNCSARNCPGCGTAAVRQAWSQSEGSRRGGGGETAQHQAMEPRLRTTRWIRCSSGCRACANCSITKCPRRSPISSRRRGRSKPIRRQFESVQAPAPPVEAGQSGAGEATAPRGLTRLRTDFSTPHEPPSQRRKSRPGPQGSANRVADRRRPIGTMSKARKFERNISTELPNHVARAMGVIEEIDAILRKVRSDCE